MAIRAVGLEKSYVGAGPEPVRVLRDVEFEAKDGELVVIVGASGSGKSTFLNLLGLLEAPDAGEIWLGGERVSPLGRRAQCRVRGASIGYVFQSFLLIERLTALDNVMLAARYVGADRSNARREALQWMERLGVAGRAQHHPSQLSGGEQQRVAFCRAVLNRPPLLLADEPTGNLDEAHAGVILSELRAQARDRGATVVLVTHRPEVVGEASRLLKLTNGRLGPEGAKGDR
jgi:putative ABC transport system ATP-binding protein